jgi:hypothetical protein
MKYFFALILFITILTGGVSHAADPLTGDYGAVERCGPQKNGDYVLCEAVGGLISQRQGNFASFLNELYVLAFILAGTVAFIRIVYGGILYSISGVVEKKKEAIKIFQNVAWGMALLMGSYVILNTINPALTTLALPNITMGTGAINSPKKINLEPQTYSVTEDMILQWERDKEDLISTNDLIQDRIQLIETTTPNRTTGQKAELESLRNQLQANEAKIKNLEEGIKEGPYKP